ncbi:MAG: DUF3750 domain-containing protein, partial [Burkholderiaceae bacterium]|nr:DUF3750 domain-containing protein [Burkholderiaceae bacterium]
MAGLMQRSLAPWIMGNLKNFRHQMRAVPVICLVLAVQAGLAQDRSQVSDVPSRSWATASRQSAGIAPDPAQRTDLAIVQVYAAPTYGWRGFFAVHPWIIYKRKGETSYTRYDVVGWRKPQVVQ